MADLQDRRGRRGMLGLFGLRGLLGQMGAPAPTLGGISLNPRVMLRPPTNANSIIRQATNEIEDDDESIIT